MATKKKKSQKRANVWQARPDDAIRLAALRWFALELERISIEIYASDQGQYAAMESVLRKAVRDMASLSRKLHIRQDEECPVGYVLCKDGICAPMCDSISDARSDS